MDPSFLAVDFLDFGDFYFGDFYFGDFYFGDFFLGDFLAYIAGCSGCPKANGSFCLASGLSAG
jgi:hypothetical protein